MKKKLLSVMLVTAMTAGLLAGCGSSSEGSSEGGNTSEAGTESSNSSGSSSEAASEVDYSAYVDEVEDKNITIWADGTIVDLTQEAADAWLEEQGYDDWTVTVESVGCDDSASKMITDVEGGADIYGFAQDQLARLVAAGALQPVTGDYASWVAESNNENAVEAASAGDIVYAFPMTADNGYFMYYDSSVVTDPSTLEGIVEQCEAAGKNFYFYYNSWYVESFFFATGCTLEYETDTDGNFIGATIDIASDAGVVALNEMIELASSEYHQSGSTVGDTTNAAVVVSGTWDKTDAQKLFGDNYACAKLPTFTGSDGETYQMYSFAGYKLIGVKPQTETGKWYVCMELAEYLTDYDMQMKRFEEVGWGPSNLEALESDEVQNDETLTAWNEQMDYSVVQGQYPNDYWTTINALASDVLTGTINENSDLDASLQDVQDTLTSLASGS